MSRDEHLAAQELDAFLRDCQAGQATSPPASVDPADARLVADLVGLAEKIQPDPAFVTGLGVRLNRAGETDQPAPDRSVWQSLGTFIATGKRVAIALVGMVALALLLILGLPLLSPKEELPYLPSLSALNAYAQGSDRRTIGMMLSPVPDVEFMLRTSLPDKILPFVSQHMSVFRRKQQPLTIGDARHLATRFGLRGPLYEQRWPGSPDAEDRSATSSTPSMYFVFDKPRTMRFEETGSFYYHDSSTEATLDTTTAITFEQAVAIAEEFLRARGLLDFSYQVKRGEDGLFDSLFHITREEDGANRHTVHFAYLADGYTVRTPLAKAGVSVDVAPNGQVASVAYEVLDLEEIAEYPIRTAQEAWEALVSHQPSRWVQYSIYPAERELVTRWDREYRPGQPAHLYGSPVVYRPIESDEPPLVRMKTLWLRGPHDELQALIEKQNNRLHVWGQVQQAPSGKLTLDLAGWEVLFPVPAPVDPDFHGTIERANGRVLLLLEDGAVFILPDPPDELRDGLAVSGQGWETKREMDGYPVLEWSVLQTPPATEIPFVQMRGLSFSLEISKPQIQQPSQPDRVIIKQVELTYYALPDFLLWGEPADSPLRIVQPMWRFAGYTEDGATVEVLLQAVRDEYLR